MNLNKEILSFYAHCLNLILLKMYWVIPQFEVSSINRAKKPPNHNKKPKKNRITRPLWKIINWIDREISREILYTERIVCLLKQKFLTYMYATITTFSDLFFLFFFSVWELVPDSIMLN